MSLKIPKPVVEGCDSGCRGWTLATACLRHGRKRAQPGGSRWTPGRGLSSVERNVSRAVPCPNLYTRTFRGDAAASNNRRVLFAKLISMPGSSSGGDNHFRGRACRSYLFREADSQHITSAARDGVSAGRGFYTSRALCSLSFRRRSAQPVSRGIWQVHHISMSSLRTPQCERSTALGALFHARTVTRLQYIRRKFR